MCPPVFQTDIILPDDIIRGFGEEHDGAVVMFIGRARNKTGDKTVACLDYEVYNGMALKETDKIIRETIERFGLSQCSVVQRYGRVAIGEASIVIAVSSPHRKDSYEASKYIIDNIKSRVPIWKKEIYPDGSC